MSNIPVILFQELTRILASLFTFPVGSEIKKLSESTFYGYMRLMLESKDSGFPDKNEETPAYQSETLPATILPIDLGLLGNSINPQNAQPQFETLKDSATLSFNDISDSHYLALKIINVFRVINFF